jgi:hypothetical protein
MLRPADRRSDDRRHARPALIVFLTYLGKMFRPIQDGDQRVSDRRRARTLLFPNLVSVPDTAECQVQ